MNKLKLRIYEPPEEEVAEESTEPRDILPFESRNRTTIISGRLTSASDLRIIRPL